MLSSRETAPQSASLSGSDPGDLNHISLERRETPVLFLLQQRGGQG